MALIMVRRKKWGDDMDLKTVQYIFFSFFLRFNLFFKKNVAFGYYWVAELYILLVCVGLVTLLLLFHI